MLLRSRTLTKSVDADADLSNLVSFLQTQSGADALLSACMENMRHKEASYIEMTCHAKNNLHREEVLVLRKIPELKRVAGVVGEECNWAIFESVSKGYMLASETMSVMNDLLSRAKQRRQELFRANANDLTRDLILSLNELKKFRSQSHIVRTIVDIVGGFIKRPESIRSKFFNFMMVGAAGTGKTTLAGVMGRIFAHAGLFVGSEVVTASRVNFVAEFEGQTASRTYNFLMSNLDRGVIFIDEAYAITQWTNGKPDSYGSEAVTTIVEFMTRYKGLYCIIVAGYEREMQQYFLSSNPGLERRFPYRFGFRDLDASEMVEIFHSVANSGEPCFSSGALNYLQNIIKVASIETNGERHFPHMYKLFENQAGSMTNLAEECDIVLMNRTPFNGDQSSPKNQSVRVMQHVLRRRIINSALSATDCYLSELYAIESLVLNSDNTSDYDLRN